MAALSALVFGLAQPVQTRPAAGQGALPATLMADNVQIDGAGRLVASGAVEVWYGSVQMTARRVVFDQRRNHLEIEGPITLSDGPDRLILADAASLSPDLRQGLIRSARLVLDRQMQVAAAQIRQTDATLLEMDSVIASSCRVCAENPTPLWEIRAARVSHDRETRQLHFERAQFRLGGVPVFYAPRLRLPDPSVNRARGFLTPQFSAGSQLGFGVAWPYFIPLDPARDLTLIPALTSRGALSLGLRYRQAFARGGLDVGGQITRDHLFPDRWRGYAYLRSVTALDHGFTLSTDLLAASDRTYLDTYDITDSRRLMSHVTLQRYRRDQAIRTRAVAFRQLDATVDNRTQPNLMMQAEWEERLGLGPRNGALVLRFGGQALYRQSQTDGDDGRDLARIMASAQWQNHWILPAGLLARGALQGRLDHVRIGDDSTYAQPVNRYAGEAMLELRWPWAATGATGAGYLIEPVAQIIGGRSNRPPLPNEDHRMPELDPGNLFALPRWSGYDAPDDGTRLNLGLGWSRHDAAGWSVEGLVGRIWRRGGYDGFDPANPQPLGQSRSHWLLAGRVWLPQGFAYSLRLLTEDGRSLSRAEATLDWQNRGHALSTSFVYLPANLFENRPDRRQEWHVAAVRQFQNGWAGRLGWEYDGAHNEFRTARAGLEFRNECLQVDLSLSHRFASSTNVTASTSLGLRVDLLGIGGANAPAATGRSCRT